MKRCAKCGVVKANQQFAIRMASPDELSGWCKICGNAYAREYRAKARLTAVMRVRGGKEVDLDAEAVGAYVGLNMEEVRAGNAYKAMMDLCEAFERRIKRDAR